MKTLYDALQLAPEPVVDAPATIDYTTLSGKEFARAVLDSREFKQYIIDALKLGELPPAITIRMMDYVWGKPAERVEHTGENGTPIVTEVRHVIVRVTSPDRDVDLLDTPPEITH